MVRTQKGKKADHLQWSGTAEGLQFDVDDFVAMDVALALVPELRIAAAAVARARKEKKPFPIDSADKIVALIGAVGSSLDLGGHQLDAKGVEKFMVPGDFPIDNEGELANAVWTALQRCKQREVLRQALDAFEAGLAPSPFQGGGPS